MAKVMVIFTGGTIAMRQDASGAVVPALSAADILQLIPELPHLAQLEAVDFGQFPGPHMDPERMWLLRQLVANSVQREDVDGVVITHGTDTLEETAYLLDLTIKADKPIIVVGAMKNCSQPGWDGPINLKDAILTALSPDAGSTGVLVVMNEKIYAASEVTKVDTQSIDAFDSPATGPLGLVVSGEVQIFRQVLNRRHIPTQALVCDVDLIKVVNGMDGRFIHSSIASGVKGIVLEAMGSGNVSPGILPALETAIAKGIKVLVVSRSNNGLVEPLYGYVGGGRHLMDMGVLFGENLPGHKARIKLMVALGYTTDHAVLRQLLS